MSVSLKVDLGFKHYCLIPWVSVHCHLQWHLASGLVATFIEAPLELQETLQLPQNHLEICAAGGVSGAGEDAVRGGRPAGGSPHECAA